MGQNFARLNFAGPRLEKSGNRTTWWAIDLGGGCRLACNYYTLRADGSPNYPRSWVLQVPLLAPAHAAATTTPTAPNHFFCLCCLVQSWTLHTWHSCTSSQDAALGWTMIL